MYFPLIINHSKVNQEDRGGIGGLALKRSSFVPLSFVLLKDFPFSMISENLDIDKAAQVELLRPEHRHPGGRCSRRCFIGSIAGPTAAVYQISRSARIASNHQQV
jgi:hypothetical protein